jgi:hypothetical protein
MSARLPHYTRKGNRLMMRWIACRHMVRSFAIATILLSSVIGISAQEATEEAPVVSIEPVQAVFGAGPFNLVAPEAGLASLASYRATLSVTFSGTENGAPADWSRIYTLQVTQTPPARALTFEGAGEDVPSFFRAEVDNTAYQQRSGEVCTASAIGVGESLAETWELAALLDSVIGAERVGAETVNDIATDHYTFDERAQGASGIARSDGDLWVAADGGYVVRYTLTTTGSQSYFGTGIDGTWMWDYQLEDVDTPLAIELPEGCPPGILDLPLPPDADEVMRLHGITSYSTSAPVADVLAFYQEQVLAADGQVNPPLTLTGSAVLGFTLGDQSLLLTATNDGTTTQVEVTAVQDPSALAITADVPDARGTVTDTTTADATPPPSTVCTVGAESLALLPDATGIQQLPGTILYSTSTPVNDAIAFYEDQLVALGAQPMPASMPANSQMSAVTFTLNGQVVAVTIISMGGTSSVTVTFASTNPFASASAGEPCSPGSAVPAAATTTSTSATAAVCTVSVTTTANQRGGPGTTFALVGTLSAGQTTAVDGQTVGADGLIWYRLTDGAWVRSDVVTAADACAGVPTVTP